MIPFVVGPGVAMVRLDVWRVDQVRGPKPSRSL